MPFLPVKKNKQGRGVSMWTAARAVRIEAMEPRVLLSTFTVTTSNDAGAGSLRAEIVLAEAAGGGTVLIGVPGPINLASPLPALNDGIVIEPSGQTPVTLNGGKHGAVLTISPTATNSGVSLFGLTITGGSAGGIVNQGRLTAGHIAILNNTNAGGNGGGISTFGAGGHLYLFDSTVTGNSAASGGGIYVANNQANLTNATIIKNTATGNGGGVYGILTSVDCTITANTATSGGGVYATSALLSGGTIFAGNTGGDIALASGTTIAGDHNLIGDGSDGGKFTTSLRGTKALALNPKLGMLSNNGGTTQTIPLLPGSPAIGAGFSYEIDGGPNHLSDPNTHFDQRGTQRVLPSIDIGAYQSPAAQAAPHLVFQVQPSNTMVGATMTPAVVVYIENAANQVISTDNSNVTLSLTTGSFVGGSSSITVAAVKGVATFSKIAGTQVETADQLLAFDGTDTTASSNKFNFTASTIAAALSVQTTVPSTLVAGTILPKITVKVVDKFGNLVPSSTAKVTLRLEGGKTLTAVPIAGVATFNNVELDVAGLQHLSATSPGLFDGGSYQFTVTPAPAVHLKMSATQVTVYAGYAVNDFGVGFNVTATDAFGNARNSDPIVVKIASGPAGAVVSNPKGPFFRTSLNKLGKYILVATDGALTSNVSPTITVVSKPGEVFPVYSVQPTNFIAGHAASPEVVIHLEDLGGNILTGRSQQMGFNLRTSGPAGVGGLVASGYLANIIAGVGAIKNFTYNIAGTYVLETLVFNTVQDMNVPFYSSPFTIAPGPVAKLAIVQTPATVVAGAAIAPSITVKATDSFGNLVPNAPIKLAIATGPIGASLLGTSTVKTSAIGVATFAGVSLHMTGSYTLIASDGAILSAKSTALTVTPAAANKLVFTTLPTAATHGKATTAKVSVEDTYGNVITKMHTGTITLSLGTHPASATLGGTLTSAVTNGVATFLNLTFSLKGAYVLKANGSFAIGGMSSSILNVA